MGESEPCRDELAIRGLVARYTDAVNRRDRDAWSATWADDGVWDMMGRAIEGRSSVVDTWSGAMAGLRFAFQLAHSGVVHVDGERGTGSWTLSELTEGPDGVAGMMVALYDDAYTRVSGEWLFARRKLNILYAGPPDLSGHVFPAPVRSSS